MDDKATQRANELESDRIKAMRALMQSSQDVVASLNATRVLSNPSLNLEDGAFLGIAPGDQIRVSSMAGRPLNVLRDVNTSSGELPNKKSHVETLMAIGSQLNSSIRVSLNPNEDSEVPRVHETITNNIQEPVQADGGPIGVSHYAGLFTSNSTTNAYNLSGGGTRLSYPNPFSTSSIGMDTSHFPKGDGIKVATQAGTFFHVSSSMDGGSPPVHKDENTTNVEDSIVHSVDINTKPTSYAGATSGNTNQSSATSSFRHLVTELVFDGVNISILRKVVEKASLRFEHTLYGYFIGKIMAFPVVEYYARSNWAKHGLKRIMMNAKGLFFFKFDSRSGLEAILEGGPWMILFEEDGISLIATYLGKPIMLDSYTTSMCILDLDGLGYTKETIRVVTNLVVNDNNISNDGFQKLVNKKRNNKVNSSGNKLPRGISVSKGFQVGKDFAFRPKAPNVGSNGDNGTRDEPNSRPGPSNTNNGGKSLNTKDTNARQQDTGKKMISNIASPNPFTALGVDDDEEDEVKNIWDESENLNLRQTRASTPAQTVFDV
ncbi:zinc knuckle CX2CX4HX4C containing protein [Tanacetum coccineum]